MCIHTEHVTMTPPSRQYHDKTSRRSAADMASMSCISSKLGSARRDWVMRGRPSQVTERATRTRGYGSSRSSFARLLSAARTSPNSKPTNERYRLDLFIIFERGLVPLLPFPSCEYTLPSPFTGFILVLLLDPFALFFPPPLHLDEHFAVEKEGEGVVVPSAFMSGRDEVVEEG